MESTVKVWLLYTSISPSKIKRIEDDNKWEFSNFKLYEQLQYGDIVLIYCRKLSKLQFIATVIDAEMAFTAGVNSLKILRSQLDERLLSSEELPNDTGKKYEAYDLTNNVEFLNKLKLKSIYIKTLLEGSSKSQFILSKRKKKGKKELILELIIAGVIGLFLGALISGDIIFFICAFIGLLGMTLLALL